MNFVNDWIRDGETHSGKKKRRLIIAGVCFGGAVLGLLAFPIGLVVTIPLALIGVVKVKNALTDKT